MGKADGLRCLVKALPDDVADFVAEKAEFGMHRYKTFNIISKRYYIETRLNYQSTSGELTPLEIMVTVVVTAIIQSVFGTGILLFGTPVLLLFDNDFVDVLIVLLPVSLALNLLQILKHHAHMSNGRFTARSCC